MDLVQTAIAAGRRVLARPRRDHFLAQPPDSRHKRFLAGQGTRMVHICVSSALFYWL